MKAIACFCKNNNYPDVINRDYVAMYFEDGPI